MPKLTRDMLTVQVTPPNNCRVHTFRETLDDDSRAVLDEALAYSSRDMPAAKIRDLLVSAGYPVGEVPSEDQIQNHRAARGACRCQR